MISWNCYANNAMTKLKFLHQWREKTLAMNDDQAYISAFLQVFETQADLFEQVGAVAALANLNQTISEMADKSDEEVADAIAKWCEDYPEITKAINLKDRKWEPTPTKQEGQEPMLKNRETKLPEYLNLKNLKKRLPNSQSPRQ